MYPLKVLYRPPPPSSPTIAFAFSSAERERVERKSSIGTGGSWTVLCPTAFV
jgi:hypothetical protein